jgi:NAD(P)H-nitrite reductase large subunit
MVICHCHAVNDGRICGVLDAGADGLRGVVRATQAGTGCGGCLPALRRVCEQAAEQRRRGEMDFPAADRESLAG